MKKRRLSIYLDPELNRLLEDYAARRKKSRSLVAEAAIAAFLTPDGDQQKEAALTKRLDRLDRRNDRLERDLVIAIEMQAVFVRFWLATTPQLPEPQARAVRAATTERYDAFVQALGRRLAKGPQLRQEIPEDVFGETSDPG